MGLNREYLGFESSPLTYVATPESIRKYAWAIGARNLIYYTNNGTIPGIHVDGMAPPTFSVAHEVIIAEKMWAHEGLNGSAEQAAHNVLMLVHGDHDMKFYKPIRPGDTVTCRAKVKSIEDKGSGEILVINVTSTDDKGDKVVESDWGLFIRGIGSGKKPEEKREVKKDPQPAPEIPTPIFRRVLRVPPDVTYRYAEASNDKNPIHIDEYVAKAAGLKGIIVHGLCTLSMSMRGIISGYLDDDPSKLKRIACRFTSPVYPGDTLIVDGFEAGAKDGKKIIGFEVTRKEDNVKVIKSGVAEADI